MKWMRWGPEDLYCADPADVRQIVKLMKVEQEEIEKLNNR